MNRLSARLLALTLAACILLVPAAAQAKPAAPKATAPKLNTTVSNMPALTWNKAKGATAYELQIASDAGFNPAQIDVKTANLRYVHGRPTRAVLRRRASRAAPRRTARCRRR